MTDELYKIRLPNKSNYYRRKLRLDISTGGRGLGSEYFKTASDI